MLRRVSLVKTYFATFATKQEGLDDLNLQLGTAYKHNNLSRWMRGERDPDPRARAVMMHRVLPGVLRAHGKATAADIEAALDKLL